VQGIERLRPDRAEHIRGPRDHPALAQHGMDARLGRRPFSDELAPVADRLPKSTDLRRGDPRLRQPPDPQQLRELPSIQRVGLRLSVLHRSDPARMREDRLESRLGQGIDRSVPAMGRLDRDRRTRLGRPSLPEQRRHRALDPDTLQDLTLTIHPHDHMATAQIDPHVLKRLLPTLVPGGLQLTVGTASDNPRIVGSSTKREASPAPSSRHFGAASATCRHL